MKDEQPIPVLLTPFEIRHLMLADAVSTILTPGMLERFKAASEPGAPIAKVSCPCCGAALSIENGDDEGEVSCLGHAPPGSNLLLKELASLRLYARTMSARACGKCGSTISEPGPCPVCDDSPFGGGS